MSKEHECCGNCNGECGDQGEQCSPKPEQFDKTLSARREALESVGDELTEALSHISNIVPNGDMNVQEVKKSEVALQNAMRKLAAVTDMLDKLVYMLMADMIQFAQAAAGSQRQYLDASKKLETVVATLIEDGVTTEERLQTVFKEKILPEMMQEMQQALARSQATEDQAE